MEILTNSLGGILTEIQNSRARENLCNLLFELSNEDRLKILHQLDKEAMNATTLSKTLSLTIQESSRHLSRLGEVGLTRKNVKGLQHMTPYGELALKQLEVLEFISKHNDYFTSHTLARIPPEFVCRICEISDSTYIDSISVAFYNVEKVIQEAETYIYSITDQYLQNIIHLFREAVQRQVKVRNIEPKNLFLPPRIAEGYLAEDLEAFSQARTTRLLEERVLERLDIYLYMSEKEVAGVAFPLPDGRFDYLGFTATDERSHKWCKDLFQYYWERAHPRESAAEELYRWVKERPKAVNALKKIATREEIVFEKELISELESRGLIRQGKLTVLGNIVYEQFM